MSLAQKWCPPQRLVMVITGNRPRASDTWRSRWLPLTSLALAALGALMLGRSLQPLPVETEETAGAGDWHTATHPAGAIIVPGLALHPGPGAATLAAELSPATAPASILAVALPPIAAGTPLVAASPGTDETAPSP